ERHAFGAPFRGFVAQDRHGRIENACGFPARALGRKNRSFRSAPPLAERQVLCGRSEISRSGRKTQRHSGEQRCEKYFMLLKTHSRRLLTSQNYLVWQVRQAWPCQLAWLASRARTLRSA